MNYRREIDGLRALAVVPVIMFHAGFSAFSGGYIGVDVFFVISGFLITSILMESLQQGTYSIGEFYERRARRILPALFVVMAACLPFAWWWLTPDDFKNFARSLVATPLFVSNMLFIGGRGYFDPSSELNPLLHTWSLSVEEQFYVVFPLVLRAAWAHNRKLLTPLLVLGALFSLALSEWMLHRRPELSYFALPTRGWELLFGALAAIHRERLMGLSGSVAARNLMALNGLLLIVAPIVLFDEATPFPGLHALPPTLGTCLVLLFADRASLVGRLLGHKVLVQIGLLSYSAYLWHQPVFAFARHRSIFPPGDMAFAGLIMLTFVLAYVSWRWVENPFRQRAKVGVRALTVGALAGSVLLVAAGAWAHLQQGFPARYDAESLHALTLPRIQIREATSDSCHVAGSAMNPPLCRKGQLGIDPVFILIGDSHAHALAGELAKGFSAHGKSFIQFTKNGCPFGVTLSENGGINCLAYNQAVWHWLENAPQTTVILMARWSWPTHESVFDNSVGGVDEVRDYRYSAHGLGFGTSESARHQAIAQDYREAVERLLAMGKKVVLILPVPEQGWNVPQHFVKLKRYGDGPVDLIGYPVAAYRSRHQTVIDAFRQIPPNPRLVLIDSEQIFCHRPGAPDICVGYQAHSFLYDDDDHVSNDGARLIVREVMSRL